MMNHDERIFLFSQNAKDARMLGMTQINGAGTQVVSDTISVIYQTDAGQEIEATLVAQSSEAAELHMLETGDATVVYRGQAVQIGRITRAGKVVPV